MIFESVESFVARGGPIQRLAPGESGEANLTGKQRVNPDRSISNAEREARKLAAQAIPVPYERIRKERRPGPLKPRSPRPDSKRNARKNAILATLKDGPVSAIFIAGAVGITKELASVYLGRLKKEGRVVLHIGRVNIENRWGLP